MRIKLAMLDGPTTFEVDCHPATDFRGVVIVDQFGRTWVFVGFADDSDGPFALFKGAVRWNAHISQANSIKKDL